MICIEKRVTKKKVRTVVPHCKMTSTLYAQG